MRRICSYLTIVVVTATFIMMHSDICRREDDRANTQVSWKPIEASVSARGMTLTATGNRSVNVLVFARKRTGSKLTARYIASHPGFFYVYEPGLIVTDYFDGMKGKDSKDYLIQIEPKILSLIDAIFECNFTGHEYFITYLNKMSIFRKRGLYEIPLPITIDSITLLCKSMTHKVVKVVRLYSLSMATQLLKKHDIKVIHVVRDPRGTACSRGNFRGSTSLKGEERQNSSVLTAYPAIQGEVVDVCIWMQDNYDYVTSGPTWLKDNYLLLRYEDMADNPWREVPKMYEFLKLSLPDNINEVIEGKMEFLPDNGQAWRSKVRFEDVMKIQKLCSLKIMMNFGYRPIYNQEDLTLPQSLVEDVEVYKR
ncbi:carbohydrate sulfotransferase 6-like [Ptychodera flava]|uniref:carbohydrate sulfotransferase 6-like n=1 Tax=Ptychodera flava TaxID=63121 RepID=UPI00396A1230